MKLKTQLRITSYLMKFSLFYMSKALYIIIKKSKSSIHSFSVYLSNWVVGFYLKIILISHKPFIWEWRHIIFFFMVKLKNKYSTSYVTF